MLVKRILLQVAYIRMIQYNCGKTELYAIIITDIFNKVHSSANTKIPYRLADHSGTSQRSGFGRIAIRQVPTSSRNAKKSATFYGARESERRDDSRI